MEVTDWGSKYAIDIPGDPKCPHCDRVLRGTGEIITTFPGKYCFICECGTSGHVQTEAPQGMLDEPQFCHLTIPGEVT